MSIEESIQCELESFRKILWNYRLSNDEEETYLSLKKMLLLAEKIPTAILIQRAKRIKPLVRIRHNAVQHCEKVFDIDEDTDLLVFTTLYNIGESYLYNFKDEKHIVKHIRRPLIPQNLQKVGEFTCYHRFENPQNDFSPLAEEVLRQLPKDIDMDKIDAFELRFDSDDPDDLYDMLLNRYESTVVLYSLPNGLPTQIKQQPVVYRDMRY